MYHPSRGGVRGGRDQFNWDDVKGDKHRENYLGHSIKAPVGRWQKGKDLHWYTKDRQSDDAAAMEEIKRLKEEEEEAMQEMLGLAPKKGNRRQGNQLNAREMSELLTKVNDREESAPSYAAGERIEGLGLGPTPRHVGRGQTVAEKPVNVVTFEKISGSQVSRDATKDDVVLVEEAQVVERLKSDEKTSSSSSEEERIPSRKRKSENRREQTRTSKKKRKNMKTRESSSEVLSDSHGDRIEGRRKVRHDSESDFGRGQTGRKTSVQRNLQPNRRHDSEESEGSLPDTGRKTSVQRNLQLSRRHDSEESERSLQQTGKGASVHQNLQRRRDSSSHRNRNGERRYDNYMETERRRGEWGRDVGRKSSSGDEQRDNSRKKRGRGEGRRESGVKPSSDGQERENSRDERTRGDWRTHAGSKPSSAGEQGTHSGIERRREGRIEADVNTNHDGERIEDSRSERRRGEERREGGHKSSYDEQRTTERRSGEGRREGGITPSSDGEERADRGKKRRIGEERREARGYFNRNAEHREHDRKERRR